MKIGENAVNNPVALVANLNLPLQPFANFCHFCQKDLSLLLFLLFSS